MSDSQTSTSSTQSNANVGPTINKMLTGLNTEIDKPAAVFNNSLYAGLGNTTNAGIDALKASANNPAYSNGINGAISSFADTASGKNLGVEAPGYQAVRNNLSSDIMGEVGSSFASNGRFGGGAYVDKATDSLTSGLGALDMQQYNNGLDRQVQAAGLLPGLYQAGQLPASTMLSAGAIQDADAQARLTAENDLFRRQNDSQLNKYSQIGSVLSGASGAAGTSTTQTTPNTPWWQTAAGGALALGSAFL